MAGLVHGVRSTNDDAVLGLKFVSSENAGASPEQVEGFLSFLRELVSRVGGAHFDQQRGVRGIPEVAGSSVAWRQTSFLLYPLYMERLKVVSAADFAPIEGDVQIRSERPGEWVVSAAEIVPESEHYWSKSPERWEAWARGMIVSGTSDKGSNQGGLTLNVLHIPGEALRSGEVDLRPAVLHALAPDGAACDRGNVASQAAITNAFWQTFWATGALRAERGATFPVAFLPVDRSNPLEFAAPFCERYVSLRRRLFGRTAILAYALEALTRARALLFDTRENRFCVAPEFVPAPETVAGGDVLLAVREMNRTGFVDAYTGANRETFAAWREQEERGIPGEASPYGSGDEGAPGEGGKIRSHGTPEDYLASVRPSAGADSLIRIHRVIPFAGCAYLRQIVHERLELEKSGKLQGIDGEVLAATNSTFFLNFPEEYGTFHSAMNDPVSLLVESGRTLQVKTMRRAAFVLAEDGRAVITTRAGNRLNTEVLVFEGEGSTATFATTAEGSFRNNRFGPLFFGAVVVGDSIVETFEEIATEIPSNGWIIGDSEGFGGQIEPTKAVDIQVRISGENEDLRVRHAFAVGPLLVDGGEAVPLGESREEFEPIVLRQNPSVDKTRDLARTEMPEELLDCERHGVPPMRFPYDWATTRAPRTALGVAENGDVLLVVVDGRADLPHSVGVTLAELAEVMKNLGCDSAMNLDGGGSSVMFVNDPAAPGVKLRPDLADGVVNLPSDLGGVERLLPVPLLICRRRNG